MSTRPPDGPSDPVDPAEQAFVRGLLGEVGREPEQLPASVAGRLDDVLAALVAERADGPADIPASDPGVVPLERARQRRRRGAQLLAAAAVVVGGWTHSTVGLDQGADDATSGGGAAAPADQAVPDAAGSDSSLSAGGETFTLSSGSLRADARRLVATDRGELEGRAAAEHPPAGAPHTAAPRSPAPQSDAKDRDPSSPGACLDPPASAGSTRLSVEYDGSPATAVLRPAQPDASGAARVRVEVWDCTSPLRLAAVVVRR